MDLRIIGDCRQTPRAMTRPNLTANPYAAAQSGTNGKIRPEEPCIPREKRPSEFSQLTKSSKKCEKQHGPFDPFYILLPQSFSFQATNAISPAANMASVDGSGTGVKLTLTLSKYMVLLEVAQ